ncbi:MAG: tRNA (adenosine(37)-N6)-dimethylallyltransferase MiaA [Acidobacteria bacterium]|nr:tRNA (adenosine(37)-N6)-dimethylallyltransferase MiaA [Acidobacteriota bacterium]
MGEIPELLSVVGPTGTGKSALALDIVEALGSRGVTAEIINADAMQFYKGMDIGTAKLSLAERRGIQHHLIDWLQVTEESTAANYQVIARDKIAELKSKQIVPVLVGGSMLYLASVLNTFEFPGRDEKLRAKLEDDLLEQGPQEMHRRLTALDSIAASRIEPNNGRRIVRALEIVMITGEPFAAALPDQFESYLPNLQIGLNSDREHLVSRLASRVSSMWAKGIVEEVEALISLGLRNSKTARQAIGYAQALNQLDGLSSEAEAIAETTQLTQRYARRQMSWFRRDPRIVWFDYQEPNFTEKVIDLAISKLGL